jgi:short subunit fatty acids transporter
MLNLVIFIYAQTIQVVTPNGGENWIVGNKYPIH